MTYPPPQGQPGDPYGQQYQQNPGQQPWDGSQPAPPMSGVPASGQPGQYGQPDPYGQPMSGIPSSGQPDPYGQPMAAPGRPAPGYPGSDPYGRQQWGPVVPPPNNGSSKAWIWAVIAGVVVLGLMVVTVLYFTSGDDTPTADPTETTSDEPSGDAPSEEVDPNLNLYTETVTGLSYEPMDEPWRDFLGGDLAGFHGAVGQYLDVLEFESDSRWVASFIIGELDTSLIGYTGPDSAEAALEQLADIIDENNYLAPPDFTEPLDGFKRGDISIEAHDVGGNSGMWMSYYLSWDDDRIDETGESVAIGVIDAGDGKAAGFFLSLPDSVPDTHLDQMMTALDTLTFV